LGSALLLGVGYYVGARVGFALTPSGQPISMFWPPNAILLAAFLLAPRRIWWAFLLTVFPAHMFAQLQAGVPMWTAVGWFLTNTTEGLIGAFCITQFTSRKAIFESVRGVFVFVGFGVLLAPFATSFLDAAAVVLTGWGHGYWPLGTERFWTNVFAELTVVPAIVISFSKGISSLRATRVARFWEAGLLAAGTVLITVLVFGFLPVSPSSMPALLYVPLPLLLWATVRFGSGGLSLSALCVALISMWYAMHGRAPFPSASLQQNVLSLQILVCVVVLPLLFLSAVMSEARRNREALQSLSGSLIEAQEQERRRIARELHDDLGQRLAIAQYNLHESIEKCDGAIKPSLTDLSEQISAIANSAHEISWGLYPNLLESAGIEVALRRLCQDVERQKRVSIRLDIGTLPDRLKPSTSLCLYRVAQEALHNVIAHGQATTADVEVRADEGRISLRVVDDGIGFDLRSEPVGLGLQSMRERVRSVGGSIDIVSGSVGTRIEVRVPFAADAANDLPGAA
jgi:two-component system sensor histidine kinase UhpB